MHDAEGLELAIERLSKLVDTFVNAGFPAVPVHPNLVKACRPRDRAAAGKHERGEAYWLADVLRTDGHGFRRLTPPSDSIKALRAKVPTRAQLLAERIAVAYQLRALRESFWPGPATLFSEIDSPIALAFIQHDPTARCAARPGPWRLAAFLAKHRYGGRRSAAELLGRLRAAAAAVCCDVAAKAKGELLKARAPVLAVLG